MKLKAIRGKLELQDVVYGEADTPTPFDMKKITNEALDIVSLG
jgi:hypothetical protein